MKSDIKNENIQKARVFISKLLGGQFPPEGLEKPSQADLGAYTAQCNSLLTIAKKDGLTACRSRYEALLLTNPELNITPYTLGEGMTILPEGELFQFDEQPITAISFSEFCAALFSDTLMITDGGRWLAYTGGRWVLDERIAYQRVIKALRARQEIIVKRKPRTDEMGNELESEVKRRQKDLQKAIALENYPQKSLLSNLQHIVTQISEDELDNDPYLLGVANGVVDLRTRQLCQPNASMLITKYTPIRYNDQAPPPKRWLQFLREIFAGDDDLIEFVRRVIGYTLTGLTKEQCFFVLYGNGANGKSTFINVLSHILGAYAQNTPFNTFEHGKETSAGNDLAKLNGARFVFTSEVNESSRFNAQRVKALSGGDKISCRFLYKDLFTYRPRFKVFMAVNHKPSVRDDSEGFWRRVRLIPFTQSFTGANADNQLEEKLFSESEAILAWCVKASMDYLKSGLTMPQSVMVATSTYRNENDILGLFLEDKCTLGSNVQCKSKILYEAYSAFAEENGLHALSNVKFSQALEKRGIRKERQASGWIWRGVGLLVDEVVQS